MALPRRGDDDQIGQRSHLGVLTASRLTHHAWHAGELGGEVVADTAVLPEQLAPLQADDDPHKLTTAMGRGALAIRLTTASSGFGLTLVACHLKSKLLSFPSGPGRKTRFAPRDEGERARYAAYALYRRAAEAVTVRALADDLLAGHGDHEALVVMGDPNDEATAATTQILNGPGGSEIGTPGAIRPDKGDPWRLWNLAPLIPEAERYSGSTAAVVNSSTTSWSAGHCWKRSTPCTPATTTTACRRSTTTLPLDARPMTPTTHPSSHGWPYDARRRPS